MRPAQWGKYSRVTADVEVKAGENLFWRIIRGIFYPGLKTLNFRAGIWHGLCAFFIIGIWVDTSPKFKISLNRMWTTQTPESIPPQFQTTICNGKDYVDSDVMDWFSCIRENVTEWRENWKDESDVPTYAPMVTEGWGQIDVAALVLVFCIITSLFHFWVWVYDKQYQDRLKEQVQSLRWIEYSQF